MLVRGLSARYTICCVLVVVPGEMRNTFVLLVFFFPSLLRSQPESSTPSPSRLPGPCRSYIFSKFSTVLGIQYLVPDQRYFMCAGHGCFPVERERGHVPQMRRSGGSAMVLSLVALPSTHRQQLPHLGTAEWSTGHASSLMPLWSVQRG